MLNTLLAVARISMLRVSPIDTVFDNAMLFDIVPGPAMEFREAVPNPLAGGLLLKADVLNHSFNDPPPAVMEVPATRSGRSVPAVPRATSLTAA